jgi:hypothetical protein
MHWRIVDAAAGAVDSGHIRVSDLLDLQPWGEPATDDAGAGDVVRA